MDDQLEKQVAWGLLVRVKLKLCPTSRENQLTLKNLATKNKLLTRTFYNSLAKFVAKKTVQANQSLQLFSTIAALSNSQRKWYVLSVFESSTLLISYMVLTSQDFSNIFIQQKVNQAKFQAIDLVLSQSDIIYQYFLCRVMVSSGMVLRGVVLVQQQVLLVVQLLVVLLVVQQVLLLVVLLVPLSVLLSVVLLVV